MFQKELKDAHRSIELCVDVMHVQGLPFLVTVTKNLKFITVCDLPNRKKENLRQGLDATFSICDNDAGFEMASVHADQEFECLRQDLEHPECGISLHCVPRNQHEPHVEATNKLIKERVRCLWHKMPCKTIPKAMIKRLVMRQVQWLNAFPPKGGISSHYSPRTIMGSSPIDCERDCQFEFGASAKSEHTTNPTNTNEERTMCAVHLDFMDGPQGGHGVLNLTTGKPVTAKQLYEIPLTEVVRSGVEALANRDGVSPKLTFHDPVDKTLEHDDASIAGVDETEDVQEEEQQQQLQEKHPEEINFEDLVNDKDMDIVDLEDEDHYNTLEQINQPLVIDLTNEDEEADVNGQHIKQEMVDEEPINNEDAQAEEMDSAVDDPSSPRPQRNRTPVERLSPSGGEGRFTTAKSHTNAQMKQGARRVIRKMLPNGSERQRKAAQTMLTQSLNPTDTCNQEEAHVLATIMINLVQTHSLQAGIKKFGQKGVDSANKEIRQLHERNCFKPVDVKSVTSLEKKRASESLIFLTEKRDGTVKSRQCANGSIQQEWMSKENTASLTVSLPAVTLTCTIDACEGREVAIVDILNAFVQTDNAGEVVHMKTRGKMVHMLMDMAPEIHKEFVEIENGRPVLCAQVLKALHGMLQSSLLHHRRWVKDTQGQGFALNPCDPCVANEMVNGKQLTLTWHVDDVKVSHVEKKVAGKFIQWVQDTHGQIAPVKPSRGKAHDCLAMMIDFKCQGKVIIDMRRHVDGLISKFKCLNELGIGKPKTPAAEHLFTVRDIEKIDEDRAEEFHLVVAAALFASKRARDDIQPTVSFLCTRVKEPDQDDWKKLLRLLQCLRATRECIKTLSADDAKIVKWWADAAFAVHQDMKSHTGGVMSMGEGAAQSVSMKQKLMGKSSTEAEIIGADDVLSHLMWTKYFLEAQGYEAKQTVLYQDNASAILLEKNGKESSSKRTRHINTRHFHIKEKVDNQDIETQCCPTDEMLGDCMSEPLQGKKFKQFNARMGIAAMKAECK